MTIPLYFNSIKGFWINNSINDKLEMLFEKKVCYIRPENLSLFQREIEEYDKAKDSDYNFIVNMKYLDFADGPREEMIDAINHIIEQGDLDKSQCFFSSHLRSKFNSRLLLSHNCKSRIKVIVKFQKKALKNITRIVNFELGSFFRISKNLTKEVLPLLLDHYYKTALMSSGQIAEWKAEYDEDLDVSHRPLAKMDILLHVASQSSKIDILNYSGGTSLFEIRDMLNFIDELKGELIKIEHEVVLNKGASGSNYNLENISSNKNRFPLVFKNAYSCELFLYIMSFQKQYPAIFSNFHDVFSQNKYFVKSLKPKYYLRFINSIYGLNEIRIRDVSSNVYHNNLNTYIKFKLQFENEIASKRD